MNQPFVVAITGLARSGKDTFCDLLIQELSLIGKIAKRFAFGDILKKELEPFTLSNYGISPLTCSPEEKELIRDLMVAHGKVKRTLTQARYFTTRLQEQIENTDGIDVAIVTDVRYDVYPEDELPWAQKIMGGTVVHIKRHFNEVQMNGNFVGVGTNVTGKEQEDGSWRFYIDAPNQDELRNDPKLEAQANYHVDWLTGEIESICRPEVKKFVDHLFPL